MASWSKRTSIQLFASALIGLVAVGCTRSAASTESASAPSADSAQTRPLGSVTPAAPADALVLTCSNGKDGSNGGTGSDGDVIIGPFRVVGAKVFAKATVSEVYGSQPDAVNGGWIPYKAPLGVDGTQAVEVTIHSLSGPSVGFGDGQVGGFPTVVLKPCLGSGTWWPNYLLAQGRGPACVELSVRVLGSSADPRTEKLSLFDPHC